MSLIEVVTAPWAITSEAHKEIVGIYSTHLRGEKINIPDVESRIGRSLKNEDQGYDVVDNVAIIPIHGVIGKRMNLFTNISGGASTELIGRDFLAAIDDINVNAIILDIDSPGGTVDGTAELADLIKANRGVKPIVSFANGLMASAAYYIGSAADRIVASSVQSIIGSIGVVASHIDVSEAEKREGIKTTEIFAGRYKRIDSQYEPLTAEGKEYIQERVDYMYSIFVDAVADHRGVPVRAVLDNMAEGKLLIGQQAVEAGLIDGIQSLDSLINEMSTGHNNEVITVVEDTVEINQSYISESYPDIATAFKNEGVAQGKSEGAEIERSRILAVHEQLIPGHEQLINALAYDGVTTGPEAAVKVLQAEKQCRESTAYVLASEAPDPLPAETADVITDDNLPIEERCTSTWQKDAEIRAEFGDLATYIAYEQANANGRVKRLTNK